MLHICNAYGKMHCFRTKIFQLFTKSYINQKPLALSTAGKMQIECQLTNLKDSNVFAHDAIHRDNFGPSLW